MALTKIKDYMDKKRNLMMTVLKFLLKMSSFEF